MPRFRVVLVEYSKGRLVCVCLAVDGHCRSRMELRKEALEAQNGDVIAKVHQLQKERLNILYVKCCFA